MEKTCHLCKKPHVEGEDWKNCPSCGEVICPECVQRTAKERKELEQLRDGDAHTRLQILCPSCSYPFNL